MRGLPRYIAIRIATGILALFVVTLIIELSVDFLPGNIATSVLGQQATPERVEAMNARLGVDRSVFARYFEWLGVTPGFLRVVEGTTIVGRCLPPGGYSFPAEWIPGLAAGLERVVEAMPSERCGILQGNLGVSLLSGNPVGEMIGDRLANTLYLAGFAALMAVPVALLLGILAALFRRSWFDRSVNVTTLTAISSPEFFVGYTLILVFVHMLRPMEVPPDQWYFQPIARIDTGTEFDRRIQLTLLPALTLALVIVAHIMRMTRASIINLLASPYIEMARLKGVSAARLIVVHALPNALAPIINVIALNLAYLITGVIVVEVVFTYNGIGQLLVDNVGKRDMPVVQACCVIFAVTYISLNLIADVLSILSNPRLRNPR